MSASPYGTAVAPRPGTPESVTFNRPAELVDTAERIYRRVFAAGLSVAVGLSAFTALVSLLQPTTASQLRGFAVCTLCAGACLLASVRPQSMYLALRQQPWWLVVAGAAIGAGAVVVGEHNSQLLLPIIVVIGVLGIATPRRVVIAAGLVAAAGLSAPQLIDGRANLGGPIVVLVPPLLFWLIVDRIATFALRLHQTLDGAAIVGETPAPGGSVNRPAEQNAPRPPGSEPPALPAPREIVVNDIRLTARQLQVVMLAAEGLRHAEIGACLGIQATQVRRHLSKAAQRTGVATTPELVDWARRAGLVPAAA